MSEPTPSDETVPPRAEPEVPRVVDLMAALEASLAAIKRGETKAAGDVELGSC